MRGHSLGLFRLTGAGILCLVSVAMVALAAERPVEPKVASASNEGEQALTKFRLPEGFRVQLWAAEPLLANPVAFCLDERGRVYVAETFRQGNAVVDNRDHSDWVDDDLAAMTVEDRLAFFKKHLGEKLRDYEIQDDRIRLLEDRDGDGRADHAEVFADGFNSALEGTGAGVLARGGNVWYTNIPHLWRLRDDNGDQKADRRDSLSYGYGVRVAFRGHDSHGLRMGPDGKLYFSIGDRGFNVTTVEGRQLVYPDQGAVLRCNPDGTELEVVASGLRNPQELAFDQYGNLFTGDNNSDSGDKARWVYVVDGGESGWRMSFQYLGDRGPWNRERLWHPQHEGQPAYIVPPITNIADGPSGLTYNPGTGFPEKYAEHFFLCDFRGSPGASGIRSFAVKPKGAAFELVDSQEFAWSILATDADFGPDGALWVSDWVEGWNGPGKGRLYRITSTAQEADPTVAEVRKLLAEGFSRRPASELTTLLAHPNMNVRLESQFALAERGSESITVLSTVASQSESRLARLHAIWGLGQIARKVPAAIEPIRPLLTDNDAEVRAQAAKVVGDAKDGSSAEAIAKLLADPEPRVRYFAALATGKLGDKARVAPLFDVLRENADADPYLRHAAVMSLARTPHQADVLAAASDASPAVRMGVLLALRRQANADVARFLSDTEPRLVEEAARAIYDVPIAAAMPELAKLAERTGLSEPALWRVISANFRLGQAEHAERVAALAARSDVPPRLRAEALGALGDWAAPSGRDRVLGLWRPLSPRDANLAANAVRQHLAGLFSGNDEVRQAATKVATKLGIKEIGPALFGIIADRGQSPRSRSEALLALTALGDARLMEATTAALADDAPLVRAAARKALARLNPDAAVPALEQTLEAGAVIEKQLALATLAEMQHGRSDAVLSAWLDRYPGKVPAEIQLDLLEAAARRDIPELKNKLAKVHEQENSDDPLAPFRVALVGGDLERGRRVFFEKAEVSCVRCHKISGTGGDVGPELSKIGSQQKRDYLLEAIALPDKQIAKGFDPVVIVTEAGKVYSGTVKSDDGQEVRLITAEGTVVTIPKSEIDEQVRGKSAMPEDLIKKLSKSELRDLLEFLAGLQ